MKCVLALFRLQPSHYRLSTATGILRSSTSGHITIGSSSKLPLTTFRGFLLLNQLAMRKRNLSPLVIAVFIAAAIILLIVWLSLNLLWWNGVW